MILTLTDAIAVYGAIVEKGVQFRATGPFPSPYD